MVRMRQRRTLNNILIIAVGGIGDGLWCMPFARELRKKYPTAAILIACNERSMPIWQGVPFANLCVKDEFWNMQSLIRTADEVYDFGGIATTMKTEMKLDPVEAIFKIGDLPLPRDKKDCRPQLTVTLDEGKNAERMLRDHGIDCKTDKIITIGLESSTANRDWPFDYVKALTAKLKNSGHKVVWLGERAEHTTKHLDDETNSIGAVNLVGKTSLRNTMAIIALTDVFVGPASGLMCVATALEIPTIGLFGAFSPRGRDKFYTKFTGLWHKIDCSPCNEHWTECRQGHPSPCMKMISPAEVFAAVIDAGKKWRRPIISKLPIE